MRQVVAGRKEPSNSPGSATGIVRQARQVRPCDWPALITAAPSRTSSRHLLVPGNCPPSDTLSSQPPPPPPPTPPAAGDDLDAPTTAMDGSERTPTPDASARERLPNLFEVLSRRTLAPVSQQRPTVLRDPLEPPLTCISRSTYSPFTFTCATCSAPSIISISGRPSAGKRNAGRKRRLTASQARCLPTHVPLPSLRPRTEKIRPRVDSRTR